MKEPRWPSGRIEVEGFGYVSSNDTVGLKKLLFKQRMITMIIYPLIMLSLSGYIIGMFYIIFGF